MAESLGVAVIGAGMAGKAHAAAYRTASALYSPCFRRCASCRSGT
ncbi:hypothetical protein AHiyo8_22050 [Arthrobacter sp. Hiyo8]|nr:hypothetical protein AHiyo8_22050 [Arthrobacter sp. Hiyo8]